MNRFFEFVKKEFYHIWRDKKTLLVLFGMPPILILLFGFAISNESKNAPIAILDNSKDEVTQKISEKLMSSGYFILYKNLNTYDEIEDIFRLGKVKQVIVFESNFAYKLNSEMHSQIQIISDATDPNTANTLLNYTSKIVMDYNQEINNNAKLPFVINTELKMRYNENTKSAYMFVPGLITIILMLVAAMMTSISITREKELGTMEILLASPMKPIQIIIAKVCPYLLLGLIDAIIILLLGVFVFHVPIKGSLVLLFAVGMLFITTSLSLGILISSITSSQQIALMISLMGLMLPTMLLSGFIFPIANMPKALQLFTNLIPAKWFNIIIKDIMLKGSGFFDLWKEILILIGFTSFFILVSLKKFKIRL